MKGFFGASRPDTNRIIVAVFGCLILISLVLSWRSPVSRVLRRGERLNGVVIGTDLVDYARHSDTLMVVSYDPVQGFLDVLSIPRDTQISRKGFKFKRINEVYAFMYKKYKDHHEAAGAVLDSLEHALSGPEVQVHLPYYGHIDYSGFRRMVDLVGGLPIVVDEPMNYDDNWGKLHIHFEPGRYWLNGQSALEYVRFRGHSGDRGRVFRQQKFLRSLLQRITSPSLFFLWPKMLAAGLDCIHTNLSWYDILLVSLEARELSRQNMRMMQLPGKPVGNVWQIDEERTQSMLQLIRGRETDRAVESPALEHSLITVEVWNASRQEGLAKRATKTIRKAGFDVVKYGSYPSRQPRTLVVDRTGNVRAAQAVAGALPSAEVVSNIDRSHLVDVSVILGDDYKDGEE